MRVPTERIIGDHSMSGRRRVAHSSYRRRPWLLRARPAAPAFGRPDGAVDRGAHGLPGWRPGCGTWCGSSNGRRPRRAGWRRPRRAPGRQSAQNAFFANLGTNGRTCFTCHQPQTGWGVSAASVQARFYASFGTDPIFRLVDGATCPSDDVSSIDAKLQSYTLLLALCRRWSTSNTAIPSAPATTASPSKVNDLALNLATAAVMAG